MIGVVLALLIGCGGNGSAYREALWSTDLLVTDAHDVLWGEVPDLHGGGTASWRVDLAQPALFTARLRQLDPHRSAHATIAVDGAVRLDATLPGSEERLVVPLQKGHHTLTVTTSSWTLLGEAEMHTPLEAPKRVVLVMIDTLRADHLGAWGYSRPTSPSLDAIAAAGTRWAWCVAPSPWTLASTRVLLTGVPHRAFGSVPTLAERFRAAGFATAAVTRNPWLSAANGISAGFGMHEWRGVQRAESSTQSALSWLKSETRDRDAFLFLHYIDPHQPYSPPGPPPADLAAAPLGLPALAPSKREQVAAYDSEIRYVDGQIERLWRALHELPGRSLLVVTADHGEEFWDHGGTFHGHSLYAELLHVPLLMAEIGGAGVPAGRTVQTPVTLQDIAPTVLAWAGLEADARLSGRNLLATDVPPMQPVLLADTIRGGEAWGVAAPGPSGGLYRYWLRAGEEHLFGPADPRDEHDRAAPGSVERWRRLLRERFHVAVRQGIGLLIPESALLRFPRLHEVTLTLDVAVSGVRVARGDSHDDRNGARAASDGDRATLCLSPGQSASLLVSTEGALPRRVGVQFDGQSAGVVEMGRPSSIRLGTTRVPMLLRKGPLPWPDRELVPSPPAYASGVEAELRALGYQ